MEAKCSVIYFPKQSKATPKKKKPGQKCTVLEWIRNGYEFPGKKPKPLPSPHLPPPKPIPSPIQVPPSPDNPPHSWGPVAVTLKVGHRTFCKPVQPADLSLFDFGSERLKW
jgi:hypothetical protein